AGLPVHHALEVGAERMRPALVAHVPTGRDVPDRAGCCAGLLLLTQRDSQATPRRAFHRSLPGAVLAVGGHAGEHAVKRQPRLPDCRGAIRCGWQHGADAGYPFEVARSEPGVRSRDPREAPPIDLLPAAGDRGQIVIADETRERKRGRDLLRRGEREPNVLETVLELEPGRLVTLVGD